MEWSKISEAIDLCQSAMDKASEKAQENLFDNKKVKIPFTQAQKLYHYCSLETFYNVIESNCFWLSHPKFMNDLSEYKYSIRVTKNFLHKYNKKNNDDDSKKLFQQIESNIKEYESRFKGFDEDKYEKLSFFTCFSSDGDSLPMWSMYRGKNIGLAMGLDFTDKDYFVKTPVHSNGVIQEVEMSPFNGVPHYLFSDIEYRADKIRNAIEIFLDHIRDFYNVHQTKFNNEVKRYAKEFLSKETTLYLINMSINLKNKKFSYENETRFVLNKYESRDIKFRVRDKFIVPYIEFPLKEEVKDENKIKEKKKFDEPIIPIKSITISPNAEEPKLVIASIRAYLNHKGYNINKIKIKQSTIPFKPR